MRLIDFITRGLNTCTEIILKFFGGVFFLSKIQSKLNIIPLGGLGEIGKNMTVFRYGDDIILVDAGF